MARCQAGVPIDGPERSTGCTSCAGLLKCCFEFDRTQESEAVARTAHFIWPGVDQAAGEQSQGHRPSRCENQERRGPGGACSARLDRAGCESAAEAIRVADIYVRFYTLRGNA